ncbi:MAG: PEP-CTERM sorting domain-containing protein [Desulfobacteraceae bacterium]|nr:PEP-CTERM sorting domain-containing protein [Desulfobacteraceae bacterium]
MKKVLVFLCAVLMLSYGNVWADYFGEYSIDNVQDGGDWMLGTPIDIVSDQTYEVTMDASYAAAGPQQDLYHETVTGSIVLNGSEVWSESGIPYQRTWGFIYVATADWSLVGDLLVSGLAPGTYAATVSLVHEGLCGTNELVSFQQEVNLGASPVPEPATILLVGSGLIGICVFSRCRKKASS